MNKNKTALFIVPRSSESWEGSEALWVTIAGWSSAAKQEFGNALVLTTDRIAEPSEVLNYPLKRKKNEESKKPNKLFGIVPNIFKTLIKDLLLWKSSNNKERYNYQIPDLGEVCFVWEHHDIFPGIGYELAQKYNAPFIKYVHAPQVWEATKWGVSRPLWGIVLEAIEAKSLKKADVVACVSPKVVEKLVEMGIDSRNILISPMAVDPELFENVDSKQISIQYKLEDKFVIGWTGSFRSFHGLDLLLNVFKKVTERIDNARLMLVGDGFEKASTMKMAKDLNIENLVIFTGRKSFIEIPKYIDTFDLAIVSASKRSDFHYSPLKLREYLGAGKATLAPNAGEIPDIFSDDLHLKLYNVGEIEETANIIINLAHSDEYRKSLAENGKKFVVQNGTWRVELEKTLKKIKENSN
jgi:glycosyltransferase involved in cell wall biosynthesis